MIKSLLTTAATLVALSGATLADTYVIDTKGAHASVNFEANHLGFSFIAGRFDTFSGSFEYDADNPGAGSVSIVIDTNSVNTNHGARDNHLRSADFFDAGTFPEASFTSTGIEVTGDNTAKITGDLTLRGITKPVVLDAKLIGAGDDPWGNTRAGFMGSTSFVPADFGMHPQMGAAPVTVTVHVEGIKQ